MGRLSDQLKISCTLAIDGFFLMPGSKAFHSAIVLTMKVRPPSVFLVYVGQSKLKIGITSLSLMDAEFLINKLSI